MKVKFNKSHCSNAKNLSVDKETTHRLDVVVSTSGGLHQPISVRFYMGRSRNASTVYCSVWIHGRNYDSGPYVSGYGSAGGYGYCKSSAAFEAALTDAGVELSQPIGGHGMSAVRGALEAITRKLGYRGKMTIVG